MKYFCKYLLVGLLNTCIGFGLIFFLMFIGLPPELANVLGYGVGILCSYSLNQRFTFQSRQAKDFYRFCLSMGIAYSLNLLTLFILIRILNCNVYLAQIFSGAIYTLSGFLLSRLYVWKNR